MTDCGSGSPMLERCAAQGPERVLQAFGQGNEALATQHDVRELPTDAEPEGRRIGCLFGKRR
jgi:hypothetical protein